MRRRQPEQAGPTQAEMPPELAMGPCIEVWGRDVKPEPWHGSDPIPYVAYGARRAWQAACDEWATAIGLAGWQARNQARTRLPWSRDFLRRTGRADLVEYYEHGTPRPDVAGSGCGGPTWDSASQTSTTTKEGRP